MEKEGMLEVEGGKIWYEMKGNDEGVPLLFVHGGPGFPGYSSGCLAELRDERSVIFYHQLGSGKSDRPTDENLWKLERFVEELRALVNHLELKKFHLMGHSWGASLAAQYALTYPGGLKSLILMGPLLSTKRWVKDANRLKKTLPEEAQKAIDFHEKNGTTDSAEYKKADKEFSKRYLYRRDEPTEEMLQGRKEANWDVYNVMWGPSEFSCTGNLKDFDVTDRLSELQFPVLYICGRYDEATPETVEYFKNKTPNSSMVIFENSAHSAQIEERKLYLKTMRGFLNEN